MIVLHNMTKRKNAAIYLLSSRKDFLFKCLESFYENWNYKYDYPVYVHYFDNIYDDQDFQNEFKKLSSKIYFKNIEYKIPKSVKHKDLFFNRKYLDYVKRSFPIERIGYLHMEYFVSDIYNFGEIGLASSELKQFDYLMRMDDDIKFIKKIDFDLFESAAGFPISSGHTWSSNVEDLKNNTDYFDVRENLYLFIKNYTKKNKIKPLNKDLQKSIDANKEIIMHTLKWSAGNLNIYDMKYFNNNLFKKYISEVNKFGGAYKHRWGDQEVLGLYNYIYYDIPLNDLKLLSNNFYIPRVEGTNYAPSTSINYILRLKNLLFKIIKKK